MIHSKKQKSASNTNRLEFVKRVTIAAQEKPPNDSLDLDVLLARMCIQHQKIAYAEDIAEIYKQHNTYWASLALKAGYHSAVAVPMLLREQVLGAFILYMEKPNQIDSQQTALLSIAAIQSSIGIENMLLRMQK
jgi:GAF domain-containing protein